MFFRDEVGGHEIEGVTEEEWTAYEKAYEAFIVARKPIKNQWTKYRPLTALLDFEQLDVACHKGTSTPGE